MPFPVSHALIGASVVAAVHPQPTKRYFLPFLIGVFLANVPDLDFLMVFITGSYDWHRSFTHSLLAAVIVSVFFVLAFGRRNLRSSLAYGLAFSSHCVLDYLTTKNGDGVELLYPFSHERLGFGWWGFSESPTWYAPSEILQSLFSEFVIFLPVLLLVLILRRLAVKNVNKFI